MQQAGVDDDEAAPLLGIIEARAVSGRTGAHFQRAWFDHARAQGLSIDAASAFLVEHYLDGQQSGLPVHRWPLP